MRKRQPLSSVMRNVAVACAIFLVFTVTVHSFNLRRLTKQIPFQLQQCIAKQEKRPALLPSIREKIVKFPKRKVVATGFAALIWARGPNLLPYDNSNIAHAASAVPSTPIGIKIGLVGVDEEVGNEAELVVSSKDSFVVDEVYSRGGDLVVVDEPTSSSGLKMKKLIPGIMVATGAGAYFGYKYYEKGEEEEEEEEKEEDDSLKFVEKSDSTKPIIKEPNLQTPMSSIKAITSKPPPTPTPVSDTREEESREERLARLEKAKKVQAQAMVDNVLNRALAVENNGMKKSVDLPVDEDGKLPDNFLNDVRTLNLQPPTKTSEAETDRADSKDTVSDPRKSSTDEVPSLESIQTADEPAEEVVITPTEEDSPLEGPSSPTVAPAIAKVDPVIPEIPSFPPVAPVVDKIDPVIPESSSLPPVAPVADKVDPVIPESPSVSPVAPVADKVDPVALVADKVDPVIPESPSVPPVAPVADKVDPVIPESPSLPLVAPIASKVDPVIPESTSLPVAPIANTVDPVLPLPSGPIGLKRSSSKVVESDRDDLMTFSRSMPRGTRSPGTDPLYEKYAKIESLEERAFQVLLDLGMIERTADPSDDE